MESAASASLSGIASSEEELDCYSGLYSSRATVLRPTDVEELRRIFAHAREAGRRVTFRAGGHSFDGQALGGDLVVSMKRFDSIEVLADEKRMRVGPGARWGAIVAKLQPLGLVPAVTVTTENATAGGTLSGDCLSRFSPAYGKEGNWIDSFDLLTTEGDLLTCARPRDGVPPSEWTREERVFQGVIGGLGYLGAVVAIGYRVLSVGQTDGRIGVRTIIRKYKSFENLAADLVPEAKRTYLEDSDPRDEKARRHLLGPRHPPERRPGRAALHLGLHARATASADGAVSAPACVAPPVRVGDEGAVALRAAVALQLPLPLPRRRGVHR